jgi:hypothetical protein
LLKLDCEDFEYQILFNTSEKVLNRVQRIILEYHDNFGLYQYDELVAILKNKGYNIRTYPNHVHAYLGSLL